MFIEYLGTEEELKKVRELLILFCEGVDNNPFLSPTGRFLLKSMSLNWLKNRKKCSDTFIQTKTTLKETETLKPLFMHLISLGFLRNTLTQESS